MVGKDLAIMIRRYSPGMGGLDILLFLILMTVPFMIRA
jgi:hypothetical protein